MDDLGRVTQIELTAWLQLRRDRWPLTANPEGVTQFETSHQFFFCVSLLMVGLLIQATVGIAGGVGRRLQNRRGLVG